MPCIKKWKLKKNSVKKMRILCLCFFMFMNAIGQLNANEQSNGEIETTELGDGYVFEEHVQKEKLQRSGDSYTLSFEGLLDVGTGNASIYYPGKRCLSVKKRDGTIYNWVMLETLYLNGEEVYCIEPDVLAQENATYGKVPVSDYLTQDQRIMLGLISYFGYGYHEDYSMEMHAATQLAIWQHLGFEVWNYNSTTQTKIDAINARLRNFKKYPSFGNEMNIKLSGIGKEHAKALQDTNNVLGEYLIYDDGGFELEVEKDILRIWSEDKTVKEGNIQLDRFDRTKTGPPVVFRSPSGSQTAVKVYLPDPFTTKLHAYVDTGNIVIKKQDDMGKAIKGAKFQVSKQAYMRDPIGSYTTNEQGEIHIEQLPSGTYYYQEFFTPAPYVLKDEIVEFHVTYQNDAKVEVINKHQRGAITIKKEGEILKGFDTRSTEYGPIYEAIFERGMLDDTQFQIRARENIVSKDGSILYKEGDIVDEFTTKQEEVYRNDKLYLGEYSLYEIRSKEGYVKDEWKKDFSLTYAGQDKELSEISKDVWNERQYASVQVEKQLEESSYYLKKDVAQAIVFGLYSKEGITIDGKVVVPKDGLLAVSTLDEELKANFEIPVEGEFYIKEITTHPAYNLDEQQYPVVFTYDEDNQIQTKLSMVKVQNELKRGAIKIYKIDNEEKKPIEGAVFGLYDDEDCQQKVAEAQTDRNGIAMFEELEPITYYVKEEKTPDRFILDETIHEITISEQDQIEELTLENKVRKSHIQVKKMDSLSHIPLGDTEFTLYDEHKEVLQTAISEENGIASFYDIQNGTYYVLETRAPVGYHISYDEMEVLVEEQSAPEVYEVSCYDERIVPTGDMHDVGAYLFSTTAAFGILIVLRKRLFL